LGEKRKEMASLKKYGSTKFTLEINEEELDLLTLATEMYLSHAERGTFSEKLIPKLESLLGAITDPELEKGKVDQQDFCLTQKQIKEYGDYRLKDQIEDLDPILFIKGKAWTKASEEDKAKWIKLAILLYKEKRSIKVTSDLVGLSEKAFKNRIRWAEGTGLFGTNHKPIFNRQYARTDWENITLKAFDLWEKGVSIKQSAQKLGVTYSCLRFWIKRYQKAHPGLKWETRRKIYENKES
jgi:transposase-like protein